MIRDCWSARPQRFRQLLRAAGAGRPARRSVEAGCDHRRIWFPVQTPDLVEPMVYALIAKARTMEAEERLEEALDYWEEAIRMADDVGGTTWPSPRAQRC